MLNALFMGARHWTGITGGGWVSENAWTEICGHDSWISVQLMEAARYSHGLFTAQLVHVLTGDPPAGTG